MERTVPRTGGEEIHLYMRTYYSLLRSTGAFQIETLVESHIAMASSLHIGAGDMQPDVSALIYSALRLPACLVNVTQIVVGQTEKSFVEAGYTSVANWERVYAPGRRRRKHYDGDKTLAVYIVSRSDIDDLVPALTAYQLEWNKLHLLLQNVAAWEFLEKRQDNNTELTDEEAKYLSELLKMSVHDLKRLELIWQPKFLDTLRQIARSRKDMQLRLISGSLSDYRRATAAWWDELRRIANQSGIDLEQRPIYFVSSNTHSIVNLLTGFARRYEENLVNFIRTYDPEDLLDQYENIRSASYKNMENFLYYVLGKYLAGDKTHQLQLREDERSAGILRATNKHGFEIEAQIIEVNRLNLNWFDSRLSADMDLRLLAESDAVILNIDYPLGVAAYEILSRVTEHCSRTHGVYIMGKAATLNARIGDVMIPNVVHDEHSQNTYLFGNCFLANDVRPYMTRGTVLDNQKAVTCLGTFLQNPGYMSVFYREGYSDIEMESGPYLSAVYEAFRPRRHPENEIVNLYPVPFDVGFLHYASDTPMKTGHNLGAGSLSYLGVEPTYATAIAILRRIFTQEMGRMRVVQSAAFQPQL